MPEKKIKQELIRSAGILQSISVLDFGCGSATLTILAKQTWPQIQVKGIDVDEDILKIARNKVRQKGLDIDLISTKDVNLPFTDNNFHLIFSCLVFHHIETLSKFTVLNELFRVMRTGGRLYIADFGLSKSRLQRIMFNVVRMLDGYSPTQANAEGKLPELIAASGFKDVCITKYFKTMFGEVQIIRAQKK